MNKEELQKTIQQIKDSQARYNREIGELIRQLERADIGNRPPTAEPKAFSIGDQVEILNPSRSGSKEGTIVKLTQTRVTVNTAKGKVVRAYKNVQAVKKK